MKRRLLAAVAITAALAMTATALAATKHPTTIKIANTSVGRILTNGSGFTVYAFTKDASKKDRCMSISGCPSTWPPVVTTGTPVAGSGVKASLLGTITISRGRHQVTYAGHPLYTYSGDGAPRQTSYVGVRQFGGTWLALNAAAHEVK